MAWLRNVLGGIAWADRAATGPLKWDDAFLRYSSDTLIGKCHNYYVGPWLRYDFRFVDLDRTTRAWLSNSSNVEPDALVLDHRAFALLEQNTRDATKYLDAALDSPNASGKTRDACLHALWLSRGLPDQAERMLAVIKDMTLKGDVISSVTLYRQAFAFRLLQQWDDALDAIDEAFNHLENTADYLSVHQDLTREREHIIAAQNFQAQVQATINTLDADAKIRSEEMNQALNAQLLKSGKKLGRDVVQAERRISQSLFNVIQILGIFISIVGLVAGGGLLTFRGSLPVWVRFLLILTSGVVVLGFFWLLRAMVASGIKKSSE